MSRRHYGYPWPSLATSPYHSSPPAGLQGYILCPHIAAVCKFVLVVLLLHIHMLFIIIIIIIIRLKKGGKNFNDYKLCNLERIT